MKSTLEDIREKLIGEIYSNAPFYQTNKKPIAV